MDYYLQTSPGESIRRYPMGSDYGERWDRLRKQWVEDCVARRSCELTKDTVIDQSSANALVATFE